MAKDISVETIKERFVKEIARQVQHGDTLAKLSARQAARDRAQWLKEFGRKLFGEPVA